MAGGTDGLSGTDALRGVWIFDVFLPSGKALTFHDVEVKIDDVNLLIFRYVSRGTQQQNVVGTSHSEG